MKYILKTYQNSLYRRGFLLTNLNKLDFNNKLTQRVLSGWKKLEFNLYNIWFDPNTEYAKVEEDGYKIFLLGLVLNPFDKRNNMEEICNCLLMEKRKSEDDFLDYLDQLSGRFVIISQTPDCTEVYHDACATRTVFYDTLNEYKAVSSHAMLIADLFNYSISKNAMDISTHPDFRRVRYLPGLLSPFDEIRPLTPNTKYQVEERTVKRIFPRYPLEVLSSSDEVVNELLSIMQTQANLLCSNNKVSVSLTAGLDSRLTYAIMANVKGSDINYFTHKSLESPEVYREDIEIAEKLAELYDNPYRVYEYEFDKEQEGMAEFKQIWYKNLGMRRGSVYLFKMYADEYPAERIHIRSNIAEIGRVFYKNRNEELSATELARLYTITSLKATLKDNPDVINWFQEFINITDFQKERFFNYDYADLFYWEHRMCLWHSWIVLESDMAYDTFILYNNRVLLSKMLSIPYEERRSGELFLKLIRKANHEVLKYPINGQEFNPIG